jgi:hypothetical protein
MSTNIKILSTIPKHIPQSHNSMLNHINADDPLQIVVRGHLYVEAMLNKLICLRFPFPKAIDLADMHYPIKVDLAVALGMLSKDDAGSFRALNKLRNRLAHNIEYRVTSKDVRELLGTISPTMRHAYKNFLKYKPTLVDDYLDQLRCFIFMSEFMLQKLVELYTSTKSVHST